MRRVLDLIGEPVQEVLSVLTQHLDELAALRSEVHPRAMSLLDNMRAEITAGLTPEQIGVGANDSRECKNARRLARERTL